MLLAFGQIFHAFGHRLDQFGRGHLAVLIEVARRRIQRRQDGMGKEAIPGLGIFHRKLHARRAALSTVAPVVRRKSRNISCSAPAPASAPAAIGEGAPRGTPHADALGRHRAGDFRFHFLLLHGGQLTGMAGIDEQQPREGRDPVEQTLQISKAHAVGKGPAAGNPPDKTRYSPLSVMTPWPETKTMASSSGRVCWRNVLAARIPARRACLSVRTSVFDSWKRPLTCVSAAAMSRASFAA